MVSIVRRMSVMVLPRERSETGKLKPWRMGPATVKPPICSKDL